MNKKIILFYERQFLEFIKNSIAPEVEIIREFCVSCVKDIEDIFVDPPFETGSGMYIGYAISNRFTKKAFLNSMKLYAGGGTCENILLDIYKAYMAGYSKNRYQRIMNRKINNKLDGIILGISHGMAGILEEKMPGNACNLCCGSQDIYFNYLTLKKCYEEYYYEIKDIKYAVIDMFDYFYFNFDTILTGAYEVFLEMSGFLCEDRAPWNKNLSVDQLNQIFEQMWQEGKSQGEQELFLELFPFARQKDNGVYKNVPIYDCELTEQKVLEYKRNVVVASPHMNVYEHTIRFQIENMKKLLSLLQKINPQIKIFMVLLPKYEAVEEAEKTINELWKPLFMKVINELKCNYSFELLDFKECRAVSGHMEYYSDLSHLNCPGAAAFTEQLANILTDSYGLRI